MLEVYKKEILRLKESMESNEKIHFSSKEEELQHDIDVFFGYLVLYFMMERISSYSIRYKVKNREIKMYFFDLPSIFDDAYIKLVNKWAFEKDVNMFEVLTERLEKISIKFTHELDDPSYMAMEYTCKKFKVTFSIL